MPMEVRCMNRSYLNRKKEESMRKQRLAVIACMSVALLVFTFAAAGAQTKEGWPKTVSIGVPSVGSSPYIVYAGLGEMMRKHLGVTGTAEAVGGSTSIVALMSRGQLLFGQISTDTLYDAVRGVKNYKGKKVELRQITPGIAFAMYFFVRANAGITKPEDVRGKRFLCYSPTASIMTLMGGLLLESVGMTKKDVVAMPVISQPDAVRALTDNTADGFIHAGSPVSPVSNFAEMANGIDVRLVPITDQQQKFMVKKSNGVLTPSEIAGGQYKGNPNPVRTVAYDCPFVVVSGIPEGLIYEVTKLIYGKKYRSEFLGLHPAAKAFFDLKRLEAEPPLTPYHAGAIKFYKELGVWTKKMDEYQKAVLKEVGAKE